DGTHLSRAGHRRRPDGAVRNLFNYGSCCHHCPATASACRRHCEDVQSLRNCGAEPVRNNSLLIDAAVLEEVAMDAAVHDEAVQQDNVQPTTVRSSPDVDNASARQAGKLDDIARRVSEAYPGDKPIVSSSGKRAGRRSGALRTARLLLRKAATAGIAVIA